MASKLCPRGDRCSDVRLYCRVTLLAGPQDLRKVTLFRWLHRILTVETERFSSSLFCFLFFSDCFEDLLEGLDDDDDFLDEALLV